MQGNSELENRTKDYDVNFQVNKLEVFYFVNNPELIARHDLIIQKYPS